MTTKLLGALRRCDSRERVNGFEHAFRRRHAIDLSASTQFVPDLAVVCAGLLKQADRSGRDVVYPQLWHEPAQLGQSTMLKVHATRVLRRQMHLNAEWRLNPEECTLIFPGEGVHSVFRKVPARAQ